MSHRPAYGSDTDHYVKHWLALGFLISLKTEMQLIFLLGFCDFHEFSPPTPTTTLNHIYKQKFQENFGAEEENLQIKKALKMFISNINYW